mmetsp:Transcript_11858/g.21663  ORF Transcript_11858/g.21663 Transcript_11858/m.21663 type:complete len:301 (+) Transcript_11858:131-1033(+)
MATLEQLGEELYAIIEQVYPEMAGKLTGMLLELGEEQCLACLSSQEKLAEMLDEAMRILDDNGQGTTKVVAVQSVEKRVDPEDGQERSLEELHNFYAGVYSRKEIEQYWLFCKPMSNSPSAEAAPVAVDRKPAAPAPATSGSGAAPAAQATAAAGEASCTAEVLPGLTAWLRELKLSPYTAAASSWIEEQGACSLDEIVENLEDFADGVNLKPLERKRLQKSGAAAVEQAQAEAAAALAERDAQETAQRTEAATAKAAPVAVRGAVARSAPPEEERFPPLSAAAGRGGLVDRGKGPRKRI